MDKPDNRSSSSSFLSSSPYFKSWVYLQGLRLMISSFSCHIQQTRPENCLPAPGHKSSKSPFPKMALWINNQLHLLPWPLIPQEFQNTAVSKPVKMNTISTEILCDCSICWQLLPLWKSLPASVHQLACQSLAWVQPELLFSASNLEELLHCTGDASSPCSPSSPKVLTSCTRSPVCSEPQAVCFFLSQWPQHFSYTFKFCFCCFNQPISLSKLLFTSLSSHFHATHHIISTTFHLLTQRLPNFCYVSLIFLQTALSKRYLHDFC